MLLHVFEGPLQFRRLTLVSEPEEKRNGNDEENGDEGPEECGAEELPNEIDLVCLSAAEGFVPVCEARPRHVWVEAASVEEEVEEVAEGVFPKWVV